jgi:cysteine synthase A
MKACFELMTREGLSLGLSSGINVAGAEALARQLGPGKTLVTILCDSASRYATKMFDRSLLASKGLPTPDWIDPTLPPDLSEALSKAMAPPVA